jgi:hypothetical protein
MGSHIADVIPPLIDLLLNVHKLAEGTQRPKVLAKIMDAFLYLPLLLGRPDMAGVGNNFEVPQKIQKGVIEADDTAATFRDGGQHIIEYKFFRGPVKKPEGVD